MARHRLGIAEEAGVAVMFLTTNRWMNGETLHVDGGTRLVKFRTRRQRGRVIASKLPSHAARSPECWWIRGKPCRCTAMLDF
jgi:hypothetical protein